MIKPLSQSATFQALKSIVDGLTNAFNALTGRVSTVEVSPTAGNKTAAGNADFSFFSAGNSTPSVLFRSTGGSSSNYAGTLIVAANTINFQGKFTPFRPITLSYSGLPGDAGLSAVGVSTSITNTGGAGYGHRYTYTHSGNITSGFSLASSIQGNFTGLNGGQGQTLWLVAQTPKGNSKPFGVATAEFNPINLGEDTGYLDSRSGSLHWSVGMQMVPESRNLLDGNNIGAYPVIAGYVLARSSAMSSATGFYAQSYNGLLIEKDAIAPTGVGVQVGGALLRTDVGTLPKFGVRVTAMWSDAALDTRDASITSGNAITVAAGQKVCFAGTDYAMYAVAGKLYFDVGGVHMFSVDGAGNAIFKGTVSESGTP